MKFDRHYTFFEQTFTQPIITATGIWKKRIGLILRQCFDDGKIGYGEVLPTPGFSEFAISVAEKEVKQWVEGNKNPKNFKYINPAISCLNSDIWSSDYEPSRVHESAELYSPPHPSSSNIIKRKIGLLNANQEIREVAKWIESLPLNCRVRLDANQSLEPDDLLDWIYILKDFPQVEYLEQPTDARHDQWLIEFSQESAVPIALDEGCLRCDDLIKLMRDGWNGYLILKPLLFPDWNVLRTLIDENPSRIIISTSFESPLGYEALLRIAALTNTNPGLERKCFLGNKLELKCHHQPSFFAPVANDLELQEVWYNLFKN